MPLRPFMSLRWLTEPVLRSFGLDKDVAHFAGVYAVWSQADGVPMRPQNKTQKN